MKASSKMYKYFFIVFFTFCVNIMYSSAQVSGSTYSEEDNYFNFYEFVLDKYIGLIKSVEMGDSPFFVLVNDLLLTDSDMYFEISISYTDSYKILLKSSNGMYYKLSEKGDIYIVLSGIQGDSGIVNNFINYYNIKMINSQVLEKVFYPLTFEFLFRNSYIEIDKSCYNPNDVFQVSKIQETIHSSKNGKGIVFFTDY